MQMEMSYVFAVVITGLVVVFLGLILLIAFISIIGRIFTALNNRKKAEATSITGGTFTALNNRKKAEATPEQKPSSPAVKAAPKQKPSSPAVKAAPKQKPSSPAVKAAPAVQTNASGDDEVIAVISAAVAMMSEADGTVYRVRSVKRAAGNGASGNAWAAAGLRESTSPF